MEIRKHLTFSILAVVITLPVGFLVLEILVRLLNLAPGIPTDYFFVSDPYIMYKPKPFLKSSGRSRTDEFDYEYLHNSFGFRDVEHTLRKEDDTFRILGLGDSFTYGGSAKFEETYLYRLEEMLNERPASHTQVEIIKAGIPRFYPYLERKLLEHYGVKYSPDLILVGFLPNDVIDTYKGVKAVAVDMVGFLRTREAQELGSLGVFLYMNSHVSRLLLRKYLDYYRRRGKNQPRWDDVYKDNGYHESDWQNIEDEFEKMLKIANQIEAKLVVVHIPQHGPWDNSASYPAKRLSKWATLHGAGFVDVLPAMIEASPGEPLYWEKDGHSTPAGYQVIAGEIYGYLTRNELIP